MSPAGTHAERSASEPVVVPISAWKMAKLALIALAFVALGIALLILPAEELRGRGPLARVVGVLCIAMGLGALAFVAVRASKGTPGLVIDDEGLIDHVGGIAVGRIPWSDVLAIGRTKVGSQRFLTIRVRDAERYRSRGGALQRLARSANEGATGTPIHISTNTLAMDHDELERVVLAHFDRWTDQRAATSR